MNRLKQLRTEKNVPQKIIADILGVTIRTVSRLEQGKSQIKPDKAEKLADFFNVSVGYLLGFSDYTSVDDFFDKINNDTLDVDILGAIDSIGEKNLHIVYKFFEEEFLKEYSKVEEFPEGFSIQESIKIAMGNVTADLWGLPDSVIKLILYWGVLTPEERQNFFSLIEITAKKNLTQD